MTIHIQIYDDEFSDSFAISNPPERLLALWEKIKKVIREDGAELKPVAEEES